MSDYSDFCAKFPNDKLAQFEYFENILAPLKEEYDEIFIDVPPTIRNFSDNAMAASDIRLFQNS
ncbi:AAA family ATPase [Enterococcus faecium]|nr:AAA family ATPase [Enterococcus faecium]